MRSWAEALMVLALVAGCGRVGFDGMGTRDATPRDGSVTDTGVAPSDGLIPDGNPRGDGGVSDGGLLDAELDGGSVDAGPPPRGPFGLPNLVAGIESVVTQDDPTLSADELLIIYQSGPDSLGRGAGRSGGPLWDANAHRRALQQLRRDDTGARARRADDYFCRDVGDGNQMDVYVSSRGSRTEVWGAPTRVAMLSTTLPEVAATPITGPDDSALRSQLHRHDGRRRLAGHSIPD